MPPPVTGKQRAARIPLDYFKHPTFLDWGRGWWALAIAALVALGWAASGWLMSGQGQTYYSRGPVTAVHATWDNDCMACHTAFTPLSGDAYARHFVLDTHAMNQKCEACHAGPPHHAGATPELACAACHHDHRGRDASLVRLTDSDCTRCHADLTTHLANGKPTIDDKVTAFAAAKHPEFAALRDNAKDPGNLKFNHARHMQADLKLDCNACHHLDAGDAQVKRGQLTDLPAAAVLPARTAGAYYLPINYETDCRGCHVHELTILEGNGKLLPHRLQPDQVHQYLEEYYTGQYLKGNTNVFNTPIPLRPLPGKLPEGTTAKALNVIQGNVQKAERHVWSEATCEQCHVVERGDQGKVISILPTNVPDVWFKSAVFDHSAHRAVDCKSCHGRAYLDSKDEQGNPNTSTTNTDVLLPGVSTCLRCHAPRSTVGNVAHGGARSDCTECHRYHNGGEPFAGIGARNRAPSHPGSIEEFLSGSLPGGK
jgi:hypothetical protein